VQFIIQLINFLSLRQFLLTDAVRRFTTELPIDRQAVYLQRSFIKISSNL